MGKYSTLVNDIKHNSLYLHDKDSFTVHIFDRIRPDIAFVGCGVSGSSGSGVDSRGIIIGIPPAFLSIYTNKDHASIEFYKESFKRGRENGYDTMFSNDCAIKHPEDYAERYEPFGFTSATSTFFFDRAGNQLGTFALLRGAEPRFSKYEENAVKALSPYAFTAFLRYRWLLLADFFSLPNQNLEDHPFGVIIMDGDNNMTYSNTSAKHIITALGAEKHASVPYQLVRYKRQLEFAIEGAIGDPMRLFQDTETYIPQVGIVVGYRFDRQRGGKYLPSDGKGWVFFIDTRSKDFEIRARFTQREVEVLRLLSRGLQDKEIATELDISDKTVQAHIQKLFEKLDTQNRTETAVKAIKLHLL